MADLEVKQVNTLPKNSVVLTDYLLAIGSTEEYQARVQDVVLAGLENYKKKYITGYNTNLSIVEAINLIYNLKNDTDTKDGLAAVRALLGEASPDASLGIQSATISEALNEVTGKLNSHIKSYNNAISGINNKIGSADLQVGTTVIGAINALNKSLNDHKEQQVTDLRNMNDNISSAASNASSALSKANANENSINIINNKIGNSSMGTTATTITGAIAEIREIANGTASQMESFDITTDKTLKLENKAADAKATGDKISEVENTANAASTAATDAAAAVVTLTDKVNNMTSGSAYANNLLYDSETGELQAAYNNTRLGNPVTIISGSGGGGGAAFDGGYTYEQDGSNYLKFTNEGEDVEDIAPILLPAGGGGGGGVSSEERLVVKSSTASKFSVLTGASSVPVNLNIYFKASDGSQSTSGVATVTIVNTVTGATLNTLNVNLGSSNIDVARFIRSGTNSFRFEVSAEDSEGQTQVANKTFTIVAESFTVNWNLGDGVYSNSSTELQVQVSQVGNGTKTLYLTVDDNASTRLTRQTVVASSTESFTLRLTPGAVHKVELYGVMESSSISIESDHLVAYVAQKSSSGNDLLLAVNFEDTEVGQYDTISIPYIVTKPNNTDVSVSLYINGTIQRTNSVTEEVPGSFTYRPTSQGNLRLYIVATDGTREANWGKTITVTQLSGGDAVTETTTGLVYKLDPNAITVTDLSLYTNNGISMTPSADFDTENGGLTTDSDGINCIKVVRGDRLTINHKLFADDPINGNGMEFKIVYKIENPTLIDAPAITCYEGGTEWNPYAGKGLRIEANAVHLDSMNQKGEEGWFQNMCQGEKVELDFNVSSMTSQQSPYVIMMWEHGTPAYGHRYESGDNITHTYSSAPEITIGSDYCDVLIYLVRIYNRELSRQEILNNYICDGATKDEIDTRLNRNQIYTNGVIDPQKVAEQNPDLRVLVWNSSEGCSFSKQDERYGYLRHIHVNGGATGTWTAGLDSDGTYNREHAMIQKVQGTSSTQYIRAGANFDFNFVNKSSGSKYSVPLRYDDPNTEPTTKFKFTENSIPVTYINYKCNTASQEHVNNTVLADWYNQFQPFIRAVRASNPKVRDTVEGYPCVLFYTNTGNDIVYVDSSTGGYKPVQPGETVLYGLGDLNNSKKNTEVFGNSDDDDQYVVEVSYNSEPPCKFRLHGVDEETGVEQDYSIDGDNWDNYFEFRYIDAEDDPEKQTAEDIAKIEAGKEQWRTFVKWVWSCAPDAAPNTILPNAPVTLGTYGQFSRDNQAYRVAKWKYEAPNYLELDSLIYHQVFTEVFTMIDNRAKNTFWCYSKKTGKWNINFGYDFDTALGINNSGKATFSYGKIDNDANTFNAADSVPFVLNKLAFTDGDGYNPQQTGNRMTTMYRNLANTAFNLSALADRMDADQDKICEALWIEDVWIKDIVTSNHGDTRYINDMTNGRKRLQRRYWCTFRQVFMDSYYFGSGFIAGGNQITWRGWTPSGVNVGNEEEANRRRETLQVVPSSGKTTITPYCDMYVGMISGTNYYKRARTTANVPVTIDFNQSGFNDLEVAICGASFISSFGNDSDDGLANWYPSEVKLDYATRLRNAQIGSSKTGYYNPFNPDPKFNNCVGIESINLEGCGGQASPINLSNNVYVTTLLTRNSNVSGITFATGGKLVTARLNAVGSITAKRLKYVQTFTLQGYGNLTQLVVTDSPNIDTLTMVNNGTNINRVRLTDIDWSTTDSIYDVLVRLDSAGGQTATGANSGRRVITGSVFIDSITADKLNELKTMYGTDISFTTGAETGTYTVTFNNYDGTRLKQYVVDEGKACPNPLVETIDGNKTIYSDGDIKVPTREPDEDYQYTFSGWSGEWAQAQSSVTKNTTITAQYARSTRVNTVRFVDYDGSVKQTSQVNAHGTAVYDGGDLTRGGGYIWVGWVDEDGEEIYTFENIVSDRTFTANYVYPTQPEMRQLANYKYAYSDDPTDSSAYTRAEIYSIFNLGLAEDYGFYPGAKGTRVKMRVPAALSNVITNKYIVSEYIAKEHYESATSIRSTASTGVGVNGTWHFVGCLSERYQVQTDENANIGWATSPARTRGNETIYPALDPFWRNFIKPHITLASAGGTSTTIVRSADYFNLESATETGYRTTQSPYSDEIWNGAAEKTFSVYTSNTTRRKGVMSESGEFDPENDSGSIVWWTRSVEVSNTANNSTGQLHYNIAVSSDGVPNGAYWAVANKTSSQGISYVWCC